MALVADIIVACLAEAELNASVGVPSWEVGPFAGADGQRILCPRVGCYLAVAEGAHYAVPDDLNEIFTVEIGPLNPSPAMTSASPG